MERGSVHNEAEMSQHRIVKKCGINTCVHHGDYTYNIYIYIYIFMYIICICIYIYIIIYIYICVYIYMYITYCVFDHLAPLVGQNKRLICDSPSFARVNPITVTYQAQLFKHKMPPRSSIEQTPLHVQPLNQITNPFFGDFIFISGRSRTVSH